MKQSYLLVASLALVALPIHLQALADAPACPAAKTAECAAAGGSACCAKAKGPSLSLRIKGTPEAVKASLTSVEGVTGVETCCESKLTKVAYNKDKVCSDKIFAALKTAGLKVEAQQLTFAVESLACGACCDKVSTALSKVKGVTDTKVCHVDKKAVVEFDPAAISADKVLAAIDATGFKATEAAN